MEHHTTTDELAQMINAGFTDVKKDIKEVNIRLNRIENLLLEDQRRTIENLETRMKKLEDTLAV
jgi:hypothetical protein